MHFRSWIEISEKNLIHNLSLFKKMARKAKVACVVKANAYGHGLGEITSILKGKADLFAVDSLEEAQEIRGFGVKKPVLILGYVPSFKLKDAVLGDFSFVVYNLDSLKRVARLKLAKKAKIHLKIETGLNRQGIKLADLQIFLDFIKKNSQKFEVEGVSTHFANIEDTLDTSFARLQIENFNKAQVLIGKSGIKPDFVHIAATAGAILYPEAHFNMVRIGIGLYGLWPSRETKIVAKNKKLKVDLRPVLSWKSRIAQVKEIKKGESVGYGRTWRASKDSRIGVIPTGYYDGFDRKLSNIGSVLVKGREIPVVGRVAMNMFMVDLSALKNVSLEEEVIIVGKSKESEVTLDMISEKLDRINYEIVSRISAHLPRIIT